jgi:Tol biopolymer transport system component
VEPRPGFGTVPPPRSSRFVEPVYRPPYLPGQEPLAPRDRPPRRTPILAPLLALIGLLLVGGGSLWAVSFLGVDLAGGSDEPDPAPTAAAVAAASLDPGSSAAPAADPTPAPVLEPEVTDAPDIVEPPPDERADVAGTIVFSRAGDIWAASGKALRRLTDADATKSDSMPTWSPDGKQIYFIRTTRRPTPDARGGGLYTLYVTDLYRMKADGSQKQPVYESLIKGPGGTWFSHVLQPDVSPNGETVAVVSDGPDGSGPVELHLIGARNGRIEKVAAPSDGDLGHNDPAFSPDGRRLAFTYNNAQGTDGVPRIGIHECQTPRKCAAGPTKLLRPGYAHPSWSPDGSWLAVEATRGVGRDIAIIDPRRGDVRVLLTNDGDSFAPVVSPNGDQIAYLHRDGVDIDVRVMTLDIAADGKITLVDDRPVTNDGSIDGDSPPEWFIPEDQRMTSAAAAPSEPDALGDPSVDTPASQAAGGAPPPP